MQRKQYAAPLQDGAKHIKVSTTFDISYVRVAFYLLRAVQQYGKNGTTSFTPQSTATCLSLSSQFFLSLSSSLCLFPLVLSIILFRSLCVECPHSCVWPSCRRQRREARQPWRFERRRVLLPSVSPACSSFHHPPSRVDTNARTRMHRDKYMHASMPWQTEKRDP